MCRLASNDDVVRVLETQCRVVAWTSWEVVESETTAGGRAEEGEARVLALEPGKGTGSALLLAWHLYDRASITAEARSTPGFESRFLVVVSTYPSMITATRILLWPVYTKNYLR